MNARVVDAAQANDAIVLLKALALTYPNDHPESVILDTAASIASARVLHLLGEAPAAERGLRLVDSVPSDRNG